MSTTLNYTLNRGLDDVCENQTGSRAFYATALYREIHQSLKYDREEENEPTAMVTCAILACNFCMQVLQCAARIADKLNLLENIDSQL